MHNLSVVSIIPSLHVDAVNEIARLYGCGENNLSVKLIDVDNNIFYGCHAFWRPEDYNFFLDLEIRNQIIPADLLPSLDFLYERIVLDGEAIVNWNEALNELGLSVYQEEI